MKFFNSISKATRIKDFRLILISVAIFILIVILVMLFEAGSDAYKSFMDAIFWAFVTITTTGYGDQVPKTELGRVVAIFTMIFGTIIVSIFTGRISSFLIEKKLNESRGLRKMESLKNHILICGWKNNIKFLIKDIIKFEKGVTTTDIVLINSLGAEKMATFLMDEDLKGINYVFGDYSEESILLNANVKKAKKALVLAESSDGISEEAIDAKVLVTVLLLHSLNPEIYVCAEVLTLKYKNYLEHMKCEEVVLLEEYSRFLLASATSYSGITKVVSKLLNNEEGETIKLIKADPTDIGKTFSQISTHYRQIESILTIGIVENMGIEREFKRNALSEAQKAPDISTLVKNLQHVKDMERNKTIFNPGDDYIIRKNSGLIVISR